MEIAADRAEREDGGDLADADESLSNGWGRQGGVGSVRWTSCQRSKSERILSDHTNGADRAGTHELVLHA